MELELVNCLSIDNMETTKVTVQCVYLGPKSSSVGSSMVEIDKKYRQHQPHHPSTCTQSGALSLVGIVEIVLSLVVSFVELKYSHSDASTPAL